MQVRCPAASGAEILTRLNSIEPIFIDFERSHRKAEARSLEVACLIFGRLLKS